MGGFRVAGTMAQVVLANVNEVLGSSAFGITEPLQCCGACDLVRQVPVTGCRTCGSTRWNFGAQKAMPSFLP